MYFLLSIDIRYIRISVSNFSLDKLLNIFCYNFLGKLEEGDCWLYEPSSNDLFKIMAKLKFCYCCYLLLVIATAV